MGGRILESAGAMRRQADTTATTLQTMGDAVALISDKFEAWLARLVAQLPNLIVAVLVVLVAWGIARTVRGGLTRGLRHTAVSPPLRTLVSTVAFAAIILTGAFVALGVLGLDKTVTSLLAGVGIVGLALGFAFQDIAANFMSGFILSVRHPFRVGHLVQTNDVFGVVSDVSMRTTVLRQLTGEYVRIPNKDVLNSPLVNFSQAGERRVDLEVGVSYRDDLERVRRVAIAAVEGVEGRRKERPVELFYDGFGDSAINFVVRFWIPFARQPDYLAARSAAVIAIKQAFDREGIAIPFPIRTLDFAPVGGTTLPDALRPVLGEHGAQGNGGTGRATPGGAA